MDFRDVAEEPIPVLDISMNSDRNKSISGLFASAVHLTSRTNLNEVFYIKLSQPAS